MLSAVKIIKRIELFKKFKELEEMQEAMLESTEAEQEDAAVENSMEFDDDDIFCEEPCFCEDPIDVDDAVPVDNVPSETPVEETPVAEEPVAVEEPKEQFRPEQHVRFKSDREPMTADGKKIAKGSYRFIRYDLLDPMKCLINKGKKTRSFVVYVDDIELV